MELYDKLISHSNKGMQAAGNFFKEQEISIKMLANNFDQMLWELENETGVKLLIGPKYELKTFCENWFESPKCESTKPESHKFESPKFESLKCESPKHESLQFELPKHESLQFESPKHESLQFELIQVDNVSVSSVECQLSQPMMDDIELIDQEIKTKYEQLCGAPNGLEFVVNDIVLDFTENWQMSDLDDYQKRAQYASKYLFNILKRYYHNKVPSHSVNMLCLKFIETYPHYADESTSKYEYIKKRVLDRYSKERMFRRDKEAIAALRKEIKSLKDLKKERIKERTKLRRQSQNLKSEPHSTPDQSNQF